MYFHKDKVMAKETKKAKIIIPRVVIADDHDLFRQILTLTLEEAGMEVVFAASNGRQAVDAVSNLNPDLVILDVVMPEMDGLAALSIIKYCSPEIPVIIISAMTDPLYMARAGELGAAGYFSKGAETQELISSIRAILAGEVIQPEQQRIQEPKPPSLPGFAFPKEPPPTHLEQDLTEQETVILSLIAAGCDNQSIIEKLHISKNTLKTHTRNIFSKLDVSDRTQAAIWALQNGYTLEAPEECVLAEQSAL
jgi:DNA-binding NarL/FixJ family response regulator